MYTLRTRFKKDIVAEFLPSLRQAPSLRKAPAGRQGKRQRVIIFCGGMPGVPSKQLLLKFFAKKGYWVFHPRYRGSWESSGQFLHVSPEKDILDIISELPKGFKSIFDGKKYRVRPSKLFLFGSSFGGPAAILVSRDPRVTKVVALSPVVDWKDHIKHGETNSWTERFTREAFGEAYRFSHRDWKKLDSGTFYNPMAHVREIDGKKIFIIHAKDDDVVRSRPVKKFAELTGAKLLLLTRGSHLSSSNFMKPRFYKRIKKFLSVSPH